MSSQNLQTPRERRRGKLRGQRIEIVAAALQTALRCANATNGPRFAMNAVQRRRTPENRGSSAQLPIPTLLHIRVQPRIV